MTANPDLTYICKYYITLQHRGCVAVSEMKLFCLFSFCLYVINKLPLGFTMHFVSHNHTCIKLFLMSHIVLNKKANYAPPVFIFRRTKSAA